MQTINQLRAQFALDVITKNIQEDKFKKLVTGAPSVILQNGFGHALAFWYQKKEHHYNLLVKTLEDWLNKRFKQFENTSGSDFLQKINTFDQFEYHAIQIEAVKILEWLKRYANAFIKDNDKSNRE